MKTEKTWTVGLVLLLGMVGGVQGATGAAEGMLFEEHVVNGIYNVGDALWGVCGAVVLLGVYVALRDVNATDRPEPHTPVTIAGAG